jgi:2-polyprenyl-3-methyl-5-hydroxy-6-metoxy-1,4-benzoquinol methylase
MQTIDHFEVQARAYEEHAEGRPEFEERFKLWRYAIDRLMPGGGEGAKAIDLGCGPGHLTHALAARGFRTISIDGSGAMLARTRERLEQHGIAGADLRQLTLPLPPHLVDDLPGQAQLIVMSSVIEYIEDDEEMLRQCARLLAAGGHLVASFPNRRSVDWRLQRALKSTPLFAPPPSRHQRHQHDPGTMRDVARTVARQDARAGTVVIGNPGGGIGTTEQHTDRHRPALQHRPCYPAAAGGKSAGHDVRRIVAELEHGRGYVE